MRISILRSFLVGSCDAQTLVEDLAGGVTRTSHDVRSHYIDDDFHGETLFRTAHLLRICDAFKKGDLDAEMIQQVAFAMMASDHFGWDCDTSDGARVAAVICRWDSPEINYSLTESTMTKFCHHLRTGEDLFLDD